MYVPTYAPMMLVYRVYICTYLCCVPSFMQPYKSQKKVQSLLNQLYEDLDTQFDIGKDEVR